MSNSPRSVTGLRIWAFAAALGLIAVLTVNALANILPLNGVNTGTLSDEIPNLFVPAGLTFSVWGIIYLLLIAQVAAIFATTWGAQPERSGWDKNDALLFVINMAANTGWIFAWHWRQVTLSLAIMAVILITLVMMVERRHAWKKLVTRKVTVGEKLLDIPLKVYLGWICVATIANITAVLVTLGWNGFALDPQVWTVTVIVAALAIALLFVFLRGNLASPLVVVWALAGIVIKRTQVDQAQTMAIWIAAGAAGCIILVAIVVGAFVKPGKGSATQK